jgi:hypothetical protein
LDDDGSWADGVGAGQANVPETGRWTSDGRFIPQQRDGEEADFAIGRFDDTSLRSRDISPGYGRVLDHGDVSDSLTSTRGAGGRARPSLSDRLSRPADGPNSRGGGRHSDGEPWATWADPYWGGADVPQSPYPAPPSRLGPRPPAMRPGYQDRDDAYGDPRDRDYRDPGYGDPRDRDYRDRDRRGRGYGEPPRRELGYRDTGYPDDQYRDRPYGDVSYRVDYDRDARYRDPSDPRYRDRIPSRPEETYGRAGFEAPRGYRESGYGAPYQDSGYGQPALPSGPARSAGPAPVPGPASGRTLGPSTTGTISAVAAVPKVTAKPDEDDEEEDGGEAATFPAVALATVGWYVVPAIVYVIWALFLTRSATASTCVPTAGTTCATSQTAGLSKLFEILPQIGVALVISVIVALLLRLVTTAWRGMTVGFAAAVVGAGVATVLFSVIGN